MKLCGLTGGVGMGKSTAAGFFLQLGARVVDTEDDDTQDVFGATWVLITSPATGFPGEALTKSTPLESKQTVRLWTDDYSNLFKILK